jgi:hypothetical protein
MAKPFEPSLLVSKDGFVNIPQVNAQWDTWLSEGNTKITVIAQDVKNRMKLPTTSFNALTHALTHAGNFNFNS